MKAFSTLAAALGIALTTYAIPARAAVKMPLIFGDHMVLQAEKPLPVWGTAEAGEKVTVSISGQTKTADATADGKWTVTLDAMQADNKPLTLSIKGTNSITIKDVLVGEVWLCSGQSNMALPVTKAKDYEKEQAAADFPAIRMFTTKWVICSPATVGTFSAAAYFFGRELHQKLERPVGLIHRSAGGTPIELWTNLDVQKAVPELKPILDAAASAVETKNATQAESDRKQAAEVEGKAAVAEQKKSPGYLFEDRIVPLIPYAIRGAIWYQGEANSYTVNANLYGKQLALLIADWRRRWGYDFPFISVQLPELGKPQTEPVEDSGRAWVRDGELNSLALPQTGLAVTLGTGEEKNNHPKDKQEAGRRLALWALADVYHQKGVVGSGPLPTANKISGSTIVITFTHTDGGLVARGGPLKGFAICGADHKWVWADAKIDGDTVILSSPEVKEPIAARYAWAGNPQGCNLSNASGLPASPFRTDREP